MSQLLSFSDLEQTSKKKQTRREIFLAEMDKVMPWDKFEASIEPCHRKAGNGRCPHPLSSMLHIYMSAAVVCPLRPIPAGEPV